MDADELVSCPTFTLTFCDSDSCRALQVQQNRASVTVTLRISLTYRHVFSQSRLKPLRAVCGNICGSGIVSAQIQVARRPAWNTRLLSEALLGTVGR